MTGYAIIIEGEGDSFSAYAPELPGCIAAGSSVTEVDALMREAIVRHLEVMRNTAMRSLRRRRWRQRSPRS